MTTNTRINLFYNKKRRHQLMGQRIWALFASNMDFLVLVHYVEDTDG